MGFDQHSLNLAETFVGDFELDLAEDHGITLAPEAKKRIAEQLAQEIQDVIESSLGFEKALLIKQEHEARRA